MSPSPTDQDVRLPPLDGKVLKAPDRPGRCLDFNFTLSLVFLPPIKSFVKILNNTPILLCMPFKETCLSWSCLV